MLPSFITRIELAVDSYLLDIDENINYNNIIYISLNFGHCIDRDFGNQLLKSSNFIQSLFTD